MVVAVVGFAVLVLLVLFFSLLLPLFVDVCGCNPCLLYDVVFVALLFMIMSPFDVSHRQVLQG